MFLEKIKSTSDLKSLNTEELIRLSSEIRQRIIEVVSRNGGHLASSLGAVEIAVALHYCLDTPRDKIIWDVGHQAYAHKILTGRSEEFVCLRQWQGISAFPNSEESVYDTFSTGHSSTAVSLALGLAAGRDFFQEREKNFKIVTVIGDGSLSGGLCFEGLNNAGHLKKDILVILNTNELSIAPNVGALSTYINKLISLPIYNRFRNSLEHFVKSRLPKGSRLAKIANKFEEGLKGLFVPGVFFEELGFRYFGPLDGHNLHTLIHTLKNILQVKGPVLLHVVTKKGKGYPPAEKDPVRFHSAGSFNIVTAEALKKKGDTDATYTDVFSQKLLELARDNPRVVAITAAMPEGTGVDRFRDLYPDRFFDVGIAEQHAVCFAAGLAKQGLKPIVAIYSTFLQRAYDQIIEEVSLQKLSVIFAIDRAGIVGEDGATHNGVFDIVYLRHIPDFVVMAPKDGQELKDMLELALKLDKPVAIRYPKSSIPLAPKRGSELGLGKAEVLKEYGRDFVIIALGSMVGPALEAMELLHKEGLKGILINSRFVKPLDIDLLNTVASGSKFIFTVEEGILEGGFGSAVSDAVNKPLVKIGLPNGFIPCGKRQDLLAQNGLDASGIAQKIRLCLR